VEATAGVVLLSGTVFTIVSWPAEAVTVHIFICIGDTVDAVRAVRSGAAASAEIVAFTLELRKDGTGCPAPTWIADTCAAIILI
jgi:hypothetical protein